MGSFASIMFILSLMGAGVLLGPTILCLAIPKLRNAFPKVAIPLAVCLLTFLIVVLSSNKKETRSNDVGEAVVADNTYIDNTNADNLNTGNTFTVNPVVTNTSIERPVESVSVPETSENPTVLDGLDDKTETEEKITKIVEDIVGTATNTIVYYWKPTNTTKIEFTCDRNTSVNDVSEMMAKILAKVSEMVDTRIVFSLDKNNGTKNVRFLDSVFYEKIDGVDFNSIESGKLNSYADFWQVYEAETNNISNNDEDKIEAYIQLCRNYCEENLVPSGINYDINREGNMVFINVWTDGIAEEVTYMMLGIMDKKIWDDFKVDVYAFSAYCTLGMKDCGITDGHTVVSIVNDLNTDNTLLTFYDAALVYDCLD